MKLSAGGDGPLVVKLAGIAGGTGLYAEEMARVAEAGFRVAALDTTGDRSDDPAPGPITWDTLAGDVVRGLDALGSDRAVLWGTSFGSLVALAVSARRPERVAGLLLCHPPEPGRLPRPHAALVRWASTRRDPERATTVLFAVAFNLLMSWEGVFPSTLVRVPGLVRASREAATPASTILEKLRLLCGEGPRLPRRESGIAVSMIVGAWDTVAPARGARRLAASIPGSRVTVMWLSGHSGAYSRPRAYGRLVVRELRRLAASG
ncbi:MAG: alpha/beta hydrolase [Acidobacteriia bacterium]|nr:alpha/beta hydrolase [Terriglobia bacterium]